MRLQRFDLTRYGKFTDKQIEFGTKTDKKPDFHIIYGPNEAGKSTLFSGLLDLIFGIGAQSSYNFIHPYNTMQLGGLLEVNGETKEFVRIKRPNNSLLDAQGRPLPESAIRADIGAIERDSYRTMFSLNDETLEQGGENILASKGDLGELLFSASAGLAQLSNRLTELRSEADLFYKFRGRNSQLQALKAQLADLKAEREQFDVFAADFAQLIKNRDQATNQYQEVNAERNTIRLRIAALEKQLNALPRLASLKRLRERLAPLLDLPQPPQDWTADVQQLHRQEIELRVQMQSLTGEMERLRSQIEAIEVDENALQLTGRLEALEDLRARFLTAVKDLPERRLEARELQGILQGILRRLDRENEKNPQNLVLSARVAGQFSTLLEARSGLDIALKAAQSELVNAEQQAKLLKIQHKDGLDDDQTFEFDSSVLHELQDLVARSRLSDHHVRQQNLKENLAELQAALLSRLDRLRPYDEGAEHLAVMIVPDRAVVQRHKAEISAQKDHIKQCKQDVARLNSRLAQLQSEKDALRLAQGLVDDHVALAIRREREEAWANHRRQLDQVSADKFEHVLRQDDQVQSSRISQISDLTRLQQLTHDHKLTDDELKRAESTLQTAGKEFGSLQQWMDVLLEKMSPQLVGYLTIDNLDDWLAKREQALETHTQLLTAERKLKAVNDEEIEAVERMKNVLAQAGLSFDSAENLSLQNLIARASVLIERESEWQKLQLARSKSEEELHRRVQALNLAQQDDQAWQKQWLETCASCWLEQNGDPVELAFVREILPLMRDLEAVLEKQSSLADRIDKMEEDQKQFRLQVQNLSLQAGFDDENFEPLDLAHQLQEANKTAVNADERRRKLLEALEEAAQREREISSSQAILLATKVEKTKVFHVETLEALLEKLAQVQERAELKSYIEDAESELISMLGCENAQAAEQQLELLVRDIVEAELTELRAKSEDIDGRCQELYLAKNQAEDKIAAVGGDNKIAAIEERRRTILLEIEEGARNYLQLRIGIAAAEEGLKAYRDKHRSSMMERASEAFSTISRGDYSGLATQPGKEGEILIARAADGSSREAQELSKGTRFQLYLALRVAGYYEFVRERPALPFIADDIMESFDDFRAEETLRIFSQMAEAGQVIYLTHHRHLCEIAKDICPSVSLHNLQG
ncbi:AAA family ATPase [Paenochrobactrum pullorum]|uniref:AAA family ATPase n=1 Tax=Paenochrobactrum pullorum TaxID=1324351 RepID=UPI0035BC4FD7